MKDVVESNFSSLGQTEKWIANLWAILVFFMLTLPRTIQGIKIVLLFVILGLIIITKKKLIFTTYINQSAFFWILYSFLVTLTGIVYKTEGLWPTFRVIVVYYVLLIIVVSGLNKYEYYDVTLKAVCYANFFISIYAFMTLLSSVGIDIFNSLLVLDATTNIGIHEGYIHIVNTNLSMLIISFPLTLLSGKYIGNKLLSKKFVNIVNVMSAAAIILSGRRILWIVLGISLLVLIIRKDISFNLRLKYIVLIAVLFIIGIYLFQYYFGITIDSLIERFVQAFSDTDEYGRVGNVRNEQMEVLFKAFMEKPILGSGAGATIEGYQRSSANPWAFEQTYSMVLFNGGIIGACFFSASLIFIALGIYKSRFWNEEFLGVLTAFVCAVIATATNPYFMSSFDFWIFVFIPILYLNVAYIGRKNVKNEWRNNLR